MSWEAAESDTSVAAAAGAGTGMVVGKEEACEMAGPGPGGERAKGVRDGG